MRYNLPQLPRNTLKALMLATTLAGSGMIAMTSTPAWSYAPPAGFADLVAQVSPAVVYIEVTSVAKTPGKADNRPVTPFDEFMKQFGAPGQNGQPDNRPTHGLGSGYIISANGEIVTNYHVVDNATEVLVKLKDGREYHARVIGSDKLTDVALLKIDGVKDLPFVKFGDSSKLRVGDAVIAVGNPFGLGGTVTAGIVSALGRDINFGPYDSYIQTDAAINRGNSGGPLFDVEGDVVGMNSAIYSPTGGSVGIGFSIPAKTVQRIVNDLRTYGKVSRGWLGVQIQQVTKDLASALGLGTPRGALVAEVQPDSPALAAGIKTGDVIVAVGDSKVAKMHELPAIVAALPIGKPVELHVLRDGKPKTISVKIGRLTAKKMQVASAQTPEKQSADALGITVQELTPDIAKQLGVRENDRGVVVTSVDPKSRNIDKLQPGDIIQEVAGQPVNTPKDLASALAQDAGSQAVLLKINRRGTPLYVGAQVNPS